MLRKSKVLKSLKQKISNRRRQRERITKSLEEVKQNSNNDSSESVNNDWLNWVALKGNEESRAEDIEDVGRIISVSFTKTNHNKFSILSQPKNKVFGPVLEPVRDVGGVEVGRV